MNDDLEVKTRLVTNRNQTISFVGTLLASVSAQRAYAPRWAELELFRVWDRNETAPCMPPAPAFVFTRIGHSRVYHAHSCLSAPPRLPFGHELPTAVDYNDLSPCPSCAPTPAPTPGQSGHDFLTTHRFEITRYRAVVCADAPALAVELAPPDRTQRVAHLATDSLPWLSARLVSSAARHDDYLATSFALSALAAPSRSGQESTYQHVAVISGGVR